MKFLSISATLALAVLAHFSIAAPTDKTYNTDYNTDYKTDDYKSTDYYKKDDYYKDSTYYPPCKDTYGGYEYGTDGYRYGYENGKSCLVLEDYYKVYGKDNKHDDSKTYDKYHSVKHAGTYDEYYKKDDYKSDYYNKDDYKTDYYKKDDYKSDYYKKDDYKSDYYKKDDYKTDYYKKDDYYKDSTYYPPCTNTYGGYEYGSDGYRYGYENGKSCLVLEDYYKVYGKDYKYDDHKTYDKTKYSVKHGVQRSGNQDDYYKKDDYYKTDDYYKKDDYKTDEYYKKDDYKTDEYYKKDDYKTDYYKKDDYYPPCKNTYGGYEYGSDGYRYGYENGKSCLVLEDYYKVYGKSH